MLIDWFTVIAQLLNFLILVWLLKRFLYQPILRAMDEREKHIAARLEEAEARKAEAEQEKGRYQEMNSELEQQRESLLHDAKAEADAERQRLMEEARESHRQLRSRLHQTLESERDNLSRAAIRRLQEEVFALARKALADLADSALENQMASVFVRQLEALDGEERHQVAAALQASNHGVSVRSTFSLPPEQQKAIESAVKKMMPPEGQVHFEARAGEGQSEGIELTADGYRMAWTTTDYLNTLEKRVANILEEELEPEKEPKTEDHGA